MIRAVSMVLAAIAAVGMCDSQQAFGGTRLMVNADNDHYFRRRGPEAMTREAMVAYIDDVAQGGKVTDFVMCTMGQRASYDSKACEPIWLGEGEPGADLWVSNAKLCHERGLDPYRIWIGRCREKGIVPWISMRMNDVHGVTGQDWFRTSGFWRRHPELRRFPELDPLKGGGAWLNFTLDYAHREVRDYHFAIFRELVDRYDADGYELDWMRWPCCLRPGREREDAHFITEFMRDCRAYADAAAEKRGHAIRLGVRVPQKLVCAEAFGLDPVLWAKEGLVELIVPTCFIQAYDYELDFAGWAAAVAAANPKTEVIPGGANMFSGSDYGGTVPFDLAAWRGWCDRMFVQGAKGIYLFNADYLAPEVRTEVYRKGVDPESAAHSPRRLLSSFDDITSVEGTLGQRCPFPLREGCEVAISGGTAESVGGVSVVLATSGRSDPPEIELNGCRPLCAPVRQRDLAPYCAKYAKDAWRWSFSPMAFKSGRNVVKVFPDAAAAESNSVVWCEIALAPRSVRAAAEPPLTVHVIVQSHLDPVWLWDRAAGTDAALATMRTMCDVLDSYPEAHLTRGESWVFETVEQCDPATFARVRRHVADGRLHVVGGTYVQPDCNGPAAVSFRRQYEIGGRYFRERFGLAAVRTGFNPDSFGHGAYLPKFLLEAGCENYMFLRPQEHEKVLPTVFRWQAPSGEEVLVARILGGGYNTGPNEEWLSSQVQMTIDQADRRYGHAACFIGVGDHGGGPARREIDWLLEHRDDFRGVKIVFSHPDAYFAALRASGVEPPVVVGELQHHAVGCYTALSRIKREVRLTEDALVRSGGLLSEADREAAWKKVLFAGFHDVYGGTCILSSYDDVFEGLAGVRARIRDAELVRTRRLNAALPPDPCQRLVFDNPGPEAFSGLYVFEPWINGAEAYYSWSEAANATVRIRDEKGNDVLVQRVPQDEKSERPQPRYVTRLDVPAGGRRVLRLDYEAKTNGASAVCRVPSRPAPEFSFEVIEDETDTWSHGVRGYPAATRTMREADPARSVTAGPCLDETMRHFTDAGGDVWVRVGCEAGLAGHRLKIRAVWSGIRQVVKLSIRPPFKAVRRFDGTPGGELARRLDGEEFPVQRYLRLEGAAGEGLACVSASVTAADVQPDGTIRLTLFRTPYACHHGPQQGLAPLKSDLLPVLDLGVHDIDLVLLHGPTATDIAREVYRQTDPITFSETTYGVKPKTWE